LSFGIPESELGIVHKSTSFSGILLVYLSLTLVIIRDLLVYNLRKAIIAPFP